MRALLVSLLFLPVFAHADLNFEPYIGGGFGQWALPRTQSAEEMELKGNSADLNYGLRLSWMFRFLFVGLDYQSGTLTWKYEKMAESTADDGWNLSAKASTTGYGPLLGFKSPSGGFMLWASLFVAQNMRFTADLDPSQAPPFYQGTSTNVGTSFALGKYFRVGATYQMRVYKKLTRNGETIDLPGTDSGATTFGSLKHSVLLGFISIPFSFF